jgi:hypothetical protein
VPTFAGASPDGREFGCSGFCCFELTETRELGSALTVKEETAESIPAGKRVGTLLCTEIGTLDGSELGLEDTVRIGLGVGDMLGSLLGETDGHSRPVGSWLGSSVGSILPTFDGASDGSELGCAGTT